MKNSTATIDRLRSALVAMGTKAADEAVACQPLPWNRETGQRLRQEVMSRADQIVARDYGLEPTQEFRDMADEAVCERQSDLFNAWMAPAPNTTRQ